MGWSGEVHVAPDAEEPLEEEEVLGLLSMLHDGTIAQCREACVLLTSLAGDIEARSLMAEYVQASRVLQLLTCNDDQTMKKEALHCLYVLGFEPLVREQFRSDANLRPIVE